MKRLKDAIMMALCAIMLAAVFFAFAVLALFSEVFRWVVERSIEKGDESPAEKAPREYAISN